MNSNKDKYISILQSTFDGIVTVDTSGSIVDVNEPYCAMMGYERAELLTINVREIEIDENENNREERTLLIKEKGFDIVEVKHRHKNGDEIYLESCATYLNSEKELFKCFFRNITQRKLLENKLKLNERRLESLYRLSQMSSLKEESELISFALEEAVALTNSAIGYFHFLNADQTTIQLYTWSKGTLSNCSTVFDNHYPISSAGIWADSARLKRPIIHNDYQHAEGKKGLPEGHFPLHRHLGVPIIDDDGKTVIIAGVGNKVGRYTDDDAKQIELIMNGLWKIVKRKRTDEASLKFHYIMEQSPISIVITDTNGIIEYVNSKFSSVSGYSFEEAVGRNPSVLKSGEMPEKEYKDLWEKITHGLVWQGELHNKKKNGELYWESATISPIVNSNGKIVNFLAMKEDITERKSFEKAFIESNEKFKILFDSSSDAIMLLNSEGFFDCNQQALTTFGIETKEDFNKYLPAQLSPLRQPNGDDSVHAAEAMIADAYRIGAKRFEWMHKRTNGEEFPAEVLLTSMDYRGEHVLQATVRDISERKKAEMALQESEERFRAIWSESLDGMRLTDPEGRIIMVNNAFCEQIGRPRQDLEGQYLDVMYEPIEGKRILAVTVDHIREKKIRRHVELHLTLWNKKSVWFEVSNSHIELTNSKVFLLSIFRDVTEKKQHEIELNTSHEFLRSTLSSIDDLVFVLDAQGVFIDFYQPPKESVLIVSKEHFIGKHYRDIGFPEYLLKVIDAEIEQAMRSMGTRQFDYYLKHDSENRWYSAKLSVRKDTAGNFDGVTIVCRDISERIEQESRREELTEELRQKNKDLEKTLQKVGAMQQSLIVSEKMASIGQLTAGIAHEINNPLAFVSSNINRFGEYFSDLQTIADQWRSVSELPSMSEDHVREYQQAILMEAKIDLPFINEDFPQLLMSTKEGVDRIKKIVEQLRGFTHMADTLFTRADINEALENTITIAWNELKYRTTIRRDFGSLPLVECNVGEMKQVFVNLLVNAAQAIEQSGTITITTALCDRSVIIQFADSGCGIHSDHLKRIFDPFFTTKPVGKGTGLGLWITSTIIERHNGTISVESIEGKGTTFTLTIPIERTETNDIH